MKTPTVAVLLTSLCLFFSQLTAQELYLDNARPKSHPFKYSYLQLDVNYLHYQVKNTPTSGLSVNGAAVFGDRLATGLALDITDSRSVPFFQAGANVPNVFEYSQFSWYNEVFFHPDSRIDISLPLKLGVGHATVSPESSFTFGETLFSSKNRLSNDFFFVSELGVNVSAHLLRTLDLNVGGSYRLTSGADGQVISDGYTNYAVHVGLRFRISKKHAATANSIFHRH